MKGRSRVPGARSPGSPGKTKLQEGQWSLYPVLLGDQARQGIACKKCLLFSQFISYFVRGRFNQITRMKVAL